MRCFEPSTQGNDRGKCCKNTETNDYGTHNADDDDDCLVGKFNTSEHHYCQVFPDKRTSNQKSWLPCGSECFDENSCKNNTKSYTGCLV